MQLTGPGVWGPPADWTGSLRLLRQAYDWGVRIFDTAWYYGPYITHELLTKAFPRLPDDVIVITKVGNSRGPDRSWVPALSPPALLAACQLDLELLDLEVLPLVLLRWRPSLGDELAFERALEVLVGLRDRGQIARIGLSNVHGRHVAAAAAMFDVAAISNGYSLVDQEDHGVLSYCRTARIPFLPYYPLLSGHVITRAVVERIARRARATPAQVALAWLRTQAPIVIPIPGTRNLGHLKENIDSQQLTLSGALLSVLSNVAARPAG